MIFGIGNGLSGEELNETLGILFARMIIMARQKAVNVTTMMIATEIAAANKIGSINILSLCIDFYLHKRHICK